MSSKILSAAVIGLEAEIVEIEADLGGGELGKFSIVGLPDVAVSESRERVRYAVKNSNLSFPRLKVTVNLAPADLKKHGPSYDLPIAVSILQVSEKFNFLENLESMLFVGELALSGDVRRVNGVLSIALKAKKDGIKTIFVPELNASEAKLVKGLKVIGVNNLGQLIMHLSGKKKIKETEYSDFNFSNTKSMFDMSHICGQEHVKRAMEIVAAGGHNMLMSGPPGSGKTLIARTMPSILPNLSLEESLEITKIYSVAGEIKSNIAIMSNRPFRSPHHTASSASLVGGGAWPRPGEISLSHRGILFLDEFGEFPRQVLESLRQPLEDGIICVSRVAGNLVFPAKFVLVAAMNPCPCGYLTDKDRKCVCSPAQIINYRKKISGPIMDRIDLHIDVPRVDFEKLSSIEQGEKSKYIKLRVENARAIQKKRFKESQCITNSEMSSEYVKRFCKINEDSNKLLKNAVNQMHLSARSYFRILKLARTIADLSDSNSILTIHVAEALQYRAKTE